MLTQGATWLFGRTKKKSFLVKKESCKKGTTTEVGQNDNAIIDFSRICQEMIHARGARVVLAAPRTLNVCSCGQLTTLKEKIAMMDA